MTSVSQAVLGKLNTNGNLTPAIVPSVTFSPTLGIAAGRIDKLGLDIRSFRVPLTDSIRKVMVPSIRRNFDEGGRPAWEPLSDVTLSIRQWKGVDGEILNVSGALKRVASQINIWSITKTSAIIADLPDKVWYGKVQQAGLSRSGAAKTAIKSGKGISAAADILKNIKAGSEGDGSIPARPFLVFQEEDEDHIAEVFIEWLALRANLAWAGATKL